MMDWTAEAREAFAGDRFAADAGIVIASVDEHTAVCRLEATDRHCNARGVVMGGALFTLADFAAAVAANSNDLKCLKWVSLNASIHYLASAGQGLLETHCTAVKHGRTTALYVSNITDGDGHKVAVVETTMIHV